MRKFIFKIDEGIYELLEANDLDEAKKIFEKISNKLPVVTSISIIHEKQIRGIYDNVLKLKEENFFIEPRTLGEIKEKLKEFAVHYPITSFPPYLIQMINKRI